MKSVFVVFIFVVFPFQLFGQNTDSLATDTVLLSNPQIFGDDSGPYDFDESDDKPKTAVDIEAAFPGGTEAFVQFVTENFVYPGRCMEEGINGKVRLRFVVDIQGKIENITVRDSTAACPEFTAEAIGVLKKSPRWIPAQQNGRFVKSWREVPIALRVE